jgi:SAM-dependent methyltransferase
MLDAKGPLRIPGPEGQLFFVSFAILSLELAMIRWISGYIINFGYFTNFVLLSAFLGIGLGCILSRRLPRLVELFPVLLLAVLGVVCALQTRLVDLPTTANAVFWAEAGGSDIHRSPVPTYLFVPLVFILVTAVFTTLSIPLGRLFGELPRLRAYTANILGSLAGIAVFALNSLLWTPPVLWFALVFLAAAPVLLPAPRRTFLLHLLAVTMAIGLVAWMGREDVWGPYYRQDAKQVAPQVWLLGGNGIYGIAIHPRTQGGVNARLYESPFLPPLSPPGGRRIDRALVIGCGAGNDVAAALAHGVARVDAVDINPWTIEQGKALHPDRPLAAPNVRVHVGDGRSFLRRSRDSYDLIVYGLPDSTFNLSDRTNLRMESFLFTVEAFREIRQRLSPGGVFVIYNHFRIPFVVDKIRAMAREAFGQEPYVSVFGTRRPDGSVEPARGFPAIVAVGPGLSLGLPTASPPGGPTLATDDWPFIYQFRPTIPRHYLLAIAAVAAVATLAVLLVLRFGRLPVPLPERPSVLAAFFFMGAAFLLLETRSVSTFGLLFGTTWATNVLVFSAIHVSILAAILVASRWPRLHPAFLFAALATSLAVCWALPLDAALSLPYGVRASLVGIVAFLPVFCANVLFATLFRAVEEGATSFGLNLLGGVLGGLVEYSSLLVGYRALLLLAAAFYLLAFSLVFLARQAAQGSSPGDPTRVEPVSP